MKEIAPHESIISQPLFELLNLRIQNQTRLHDS